MLRRRALVAISTGVVAVMACAAARGQVVPVENVQTHPSAPARFDLVLPAGNSMPRLPDTSLTPSVQTLRLALPGSLRPAAAEAAQAPRAEAQAADAGLGGVYAGAAAASGGAPASARATRGGRAKTAAQAAAPARRSVPRLSGISPAPPAHAPEHALAGELQAAAARAARALRADAQTASVGLGEVYAGAASAPNGEFVMASAASNGPRSGPGRGGRAKTAAQTGEPAVVSAERQPPHPGNPGAEIWKFRFSDDMEIFVAHYGGGEAGLPPVQIMSGYAGNFAYLHHFASRLNRTFSVDLIQVPGQGMPGVYSSNPARSNGYEYTIEGFAALHLQPLCAEISRRFYGGAKLFLMGHSRAGYIVRFLNTALRVAKSGLGNPILSRSPRTERALRKTFAGLFSLASPIKNDPQIVQSILTLHKSLQDVETIPRIPGAWERMVLTELTRLIQGDKPIDSLLGFPLPKKAIAGMQLSRMMIGRNPRFRAEIAFETLRHANKFYFGDLLPPRAAIEELAAFATGKLWSTIGLNAETDAPFLVPREIIRSRKDPRSVPLHLIHAEDDGFIDDFWREVRMDPRSEGLVPEGGHGGILFNDETIGQIHDFLLQLALRLKGD